MTYEGESDYSEEDIPSKKARVSHACDSCKKRRTKCSGGHPCETCLGKGFDCVYSDSKKRGPSRTHDDKMRSLEEKVSALQKLVMTLVPGNSGAGRPQVAPVMRVEEKTEMDPNATLVQNMNTPIFIQDGRDSTPRYIGNSSLYLNTPPFDKSVQSQNNLVTTVKVQDTRSHIEIPQSYLKYPCPVPLIIRLTEIYFKSIHPHFPMIDQNDFLLHLNSTETPFGFTLLLNCVMAAVTQVCDPIPGLNISIYQLHIEFLKRARHLLPNHIDRCSIYVSQAIILLTICGLSHPEELNPSMYIGLAVRSCQEMGMHRNLNKQRIKAALTEKTLILYRRTWFCLYIIDRYVSLVCGRPLSIRHGDWDTAVEHLERTSLGIADEFVDFTIFEEFIELVSIMGEISELSYRTSITEEQKANQLQTIQDKLHKWFVSQSISLQKLITGEIPVYVVWGPKHNVALAYHAAEIILLKLRGEPIVFERNLGPMTQIIASMPEPILSQGVYIVPYFSVYFLALLGGYSSMTPEGMRKLEFLQVLSSVSKMEKINSVIYTLRLFVMESMELRGIDTVAFLGENLTNLLPVGVTHSDLSTGMYSVLADSMKSPAYIKIISKFPNLRKKFVNEEEGVNNNPILDGADRIFDETLLSELFKIN